MIHGVIRAIKKRKEEEIEADEVHNLEGYQVKFLKLLEIFFNICLMKVFRIDPKG